MKKKKISWPSEASLKKMRVKLEEKPGSYVLPADAGAVDRAKYETCKQILLFMHKKGFTQRQLAKVMDAPETRISEIIHYRIWKFTLDKLISYLEKLNPKVALKVA